MRFARPSLDIAHVRGTLPILFAPVAQLDRASDYGSEGCVFESRRVQIKFQSRSAADYEYLDWQEFLAYCRNTAVKISGALRQVLIAVTGWAKLYPRP
jgi:hypothetical protein